MVGKRRVNQLEPQILALGGSIVKNLSAARNGFLSLSLHLPTMHVCRKASAWVLIAVGCWQSMSCSYTIAASKSLSRPSHNHHLFILDI